MLSQVTQAASDCRAPSQLGPLAWPGPEAAVEIVIAECSAILLWPF